MIVRDEYGRRWEVGTGAAASPLVNALTRRRYTTIILPRRTIASGTLYDPTILPESLKARTRLFDCLDLLKEA